MVLLVYTLFFAIVPISVVASFKKIKALIGSHAQLAEVLRSSINLVSFLRLLAVLRSLSPPLKENHSLCFPCAKSCNHFRLANILSDILLFDFSVFR